MDLPKLAVALAAFASTCSTPLFAADAGCGETSVPTFQVQGRGDASEFVGQTVVVEAVVTGAFAGSGSAGAQRLVSVQDRHGDGDDRTSDGLLVYINATTVITGSVSLLPNERLRVWGAVVEYEGETQLVAHAIASCGTDEPPLPVEITFPLEASRRWGETAWVGDFEAREGMLVRLPAGLHINDLSANLRHGELSLVHGDLPWVFTHTREPHADEYDAHERAISRRSVGLDDGSDVLYPEPPWPSIALGSELAAPLIGVVREPRADALPGQLAYRIVPAAPPSFHPSGGALTAAQDDISKSPGALRVVSVNLHNLFSAGGNNAACYPSQTDSDCRGDPNSTARAAHLETSARRVASLEPDVVAASEVQNDFGNGGETWQAWVRQLDVAVAERIEAQEGSAHCSGYRAVLPEVYLGGDAIAVAVAYCADHLELTEVSWPTEEDIAGWGRGIFGEPNTSRVPLLAGFRVRGSGRHWAVVVNHFKSRSPGVLETSCPTEGGRDCDARDGQGFWNETRLNAASAVASWVERWDVPVLLVGDLNAYVHEQPLTRLRERGFSLLTAGRVPVPSYIYAGRLGVLDHALITDPHLATVERAGVVAQNVGVGLGAVSYSDHNPIFVDLNLEPPMTCDCDATGAVRGSSEDDVLIGTPGSDVMCGFGGDDVLLGLGGDDCISGGLGEDWLVLDPSTTNYDGEHLVMSGTSATTCDF